MNMADLLAHPVRTHFAQPLMTVHTIDQSNGELKPSHQYLMGTQPNWAEIVDLIKS
jgi:hypothetical protein